MSAPARKRVSIISRESDAGPSVASCLVRLRQRCANLGMAATDVACCAGAAGVTTSTVVSGSAVVEDSAVFKLRVAWIVDSLLGEKQLTDVLPMTAKRAITLVQAGEIFMVLIVYCDNQKYVMDFFGDVFIQLQLQQLEAK